MLLSSKELLVQRFATLSKSRRRLGFAPGLAVVWTGADLATAAYVRVKQALAKKLDCQFFLHHFPSLSSQQQLEAVLEGLNRRADVHGIVLQLPLAKGLDIERLIGRIDSSKDIDNLRGDSPFDSPTPKSIIALLQFHQFDPHQRSAVLLGAGRLVGLPLAKLFVEHNWPLTVIASQAASRTVEIRRHDLLIAATGVKGLVVPKMLRREMVVVDASGRDVADPKIFEHSVEAITSAKGAVGPLTVSFLFENLIKAAARQKAELGLSA